MENLQQKVQQKQYTVTISGSSAVTLAPAPTRTGDRIFLTHVQIYAAGATVVTLSAGGTQVIPPILFSGAGSESIVFDGDNPACAAVVNASLTVSQTQSVNTTVTVGVVAD